MSPKQKKLAAKAPPPNKIDEKDFAILRAEKAKGRGMGLQDEKVQPGKVKKAFMGLAVEAFKKSKKKGAKGLEFLSPVMMAKRIMGKRQGGMTPIKEDPTKTRNPFQRRRQQLAGSGSGVGRMIKSGIKKTLAGALLGAAGAGAAYAGRKLGKVLDERKARKRDTAKVKKPTYSSKAPVRVDYTESGAKRPMKKMGGGMMKRPMGYTKGGGADTGRIGEIKSKLATAGDSFPKRQRPRLQAPKRGPMKPAKKFVGRMEGGMIGSMQRPMGFKSGTSVKVKCKLGRNKPTKMY